MTLKQKVLPVIGLLSGALVWGLMWYPYRILQNMGVGGEISTLIGYCIALILGLYFVGPVWRELKIAGWMGIVLLFNAGWTNLGYVLSMLDGEVMRVLLLFYLAPLWTVFFSHWLLGEKLNYYGYAVVALSLCGAVVMLWDVQLGLPLPQNRAEWIALSAGISFALTNVAVRRMQHLSVNFKVFSVWVGTILFTIILLLFQGDIGLRMQSVPSNTWWLLCLVGLVLCAISFAVQYGLTYLPANQAIVLLLSELVFAAVSSYFLADEKMELHEMVGAVLIISASLLSEKCTPSHEE